MRVTLHLLFITACSVLADTNKDRGSKLPFVADAVGNALPPPTNVPSSVGSPVNLLTPDRYEFYTFDESGELVKRLMTLEEIQAIVAAGEEGDSMVTFGNDDQPTVAFNFSQPPSTKVHSVVTNVQNVLKAQMEAHKNRPLVQPTLDTPDVSDSWSLILPSIFGNTGVDIVPDKTSAYFTTPETETLEINSGNDVGNNLLSKEGNQNIHNITIPQDKIDVSTEKLVTNIVVPEDELTKVSEILSPDTTLASSTTTPKPSKLTTIVQKRPTASTIEMKVSEKSTTQKPYSTIKTQPSSTTTSSTTTTSTTTSTAKPTTIKITPSSTLKTTTKPTTTTLKPTESDINKIKNEIIDTTTNSQNNIIFEKISTFIPISTMKYVTERITDKPSTIKAPTVTSKTSITTPVVNKITTTTINVSTLTPVLSTTRESESDKKNTTIITTQSISPSTTVSSTTNSVVENAESDDKVMAIISESGIDENSEIKNEPLIPLFDVAQSISQIASDLGGDFRPLPTVSNVVDTTEYIDENLESKENVDIDIPTAADSTISKTNNKSKVEDNFIKISTLDPHPEITKKNTPEKEIINLNINHTTTSEKPLETETTIIISESSTIDPILNESMDDLISQVVNEVPQTIVDSESNNDLSTTEHLNESTTTEKNDLEITSKVNLNIDKNTFISTENIKDLNITTPTSEVVDAATTEQNILENVVTEITLSITKADITNDTNNYVQISLSNSESGLETTTIVIAKKESVGNISNVAQSNPNIEIETIQDNKLIHIDNNDIPSVQTTTIKINLTNDTSILKENNSSSTTVGKVDLFNKISNNKKEVNTYKEETIRETSPKIEEFKKKIQKVNLAEEELSNSRNNSWKLISTVTPPKGIDTPKEKVKAENQFISDHEDKDIILEFSKENQGLEVTTKDLSEDIAQFTELCNALAFKYWTIMTENVDKKRSFVLSPYSITSMLAMMFMGARGSTSGEMNEILKLDDMVTFNPHFTLKNISDSIDMSQNSGIIVSAFIRELFSDRNKGKILTFYKERAQHFYNGHVEEINYKLISDIIRRRTNLLVKRYTYGKIPEYLKTNTIAMEPPLAAFSANIFQTDCTGSSVGGRDGEMYFVVSPNVRQRRLVPVPAVVYKYGFLAGYDPVLDATAAALGDTNSIVSTLFVMPGQQGNVVHAEDLEKLEHRLLEANPSTTAWNRLLRALLPRIGLELQIPRFSHKSVFNVSSSLRKMGLKDLFDAEHADLGGLNGPSKDLFLSDMVQMTSFVTCGEDVIGEQHHVEEYPESVPSQRRRTSRWASYWEEPRDYQRAFHDPHDVGEAMNLPLHLRPRQARLPTRNVQPARLKFDRPFLFFTRHNPTGMILYVGRYNPRLLP